MVPSTQNTLPCYIICCRTPAGEPKSPARGPAGKGKSQRPSHAPVLTALLPQAQRGAAEGLAAYEKCSRHPQCPKPVGHKGLCTTNGKGANGTNIPTGDASRIVCLATDMLLAVGEQALTLKVICMLGSPWDQGSRDGFRQEGVY